MNHSTELVLFTFSNIGRNILAAIAANIKQEYSSLWVEFNLAQIHY